MAFDATDNRINMDIYPPVNIQKGCGKPSMNVDNSPKKKTLVLTTSSCAFTVHQIPFLMTKSW